MLKLSLGASLVELPVLQSFRPSSNFISLKLLQYLLRTLSCGLKVSGILSNGYSGAESISWKKWKIACHSKAQDTKIVLLTSIQFPSKPCYENIKLKLLISSEKKEHHRNITGCSLQWNETIWVRIADNSVLIGNWYKNKDIGKARLKSQ